MIFTVKCRLIWLLVLTVLELPSFTFLLWHHDLNCFASILVVVDATNVDTVAVPLSSSIHINNSENDDENDSEKQDTIISIEQQLISSDPSLFAILKSSKHAEFSTAGGLVWRNLAVSISGSSSSSSSSTTTTTTTTTTTQEQFDGTDNENDDIDDDQSERSSTSGSTQKQYIVHPTSGVLPNGMVCGILGPSGAGKTSFLSAIAGLLPSNAVDGITSLYYSENSTNHNIQQSKIQTNQVGWLQQFDDFFTELTVRETLQLASFFELPNINSTYRTQLIQSTVESLGIQSTLDRQIGSASSSSISSSSTGLQNSIQKQVSKLQRIFFRNKKMKKAAKHNKKKKIYSGRLSGGERRRVSVALELLTNNQVILLADEPTTGLDSRMSVVVMNLLHTLTKQRNIPVLCTLHQPQSSIWNQLDYILLIGPGGYVCYYGRRIDIVPYFSKLGYPLPTNTNPAEYLIDLMSIDSEDPTTAENDKQRIQSLANQFTLSQQQQWQSQTTNIKQMQQHNDDDETLSTNNNSYRKQVENRIPSSDDKKKSIFVKGISSIFMPIIQSGRRISALVRRSFRQSTRDIQLILLLLVLNFGNGMLLTSVFPTVTKGTVPYINSIADRVAIMSFAALNLGMMGFLKSVSIFSKEKYILLREFRKNYYTPLEYLLGKIIAELPIDCLYSIFFSLLLKNSCGILITTKKLTLSFLSLTISCTTLGYLLGSIGNPFTAGSGGVLGGASSSDTASSSSTTSSIPIIILLMVVGVINPSGVDLSKPQPLPVRILKFISPFTYTIEALCLGEYPGVKFYMENDIELTTGNRIGRIIKHFFSRVQSIKKMGGLALISNGDEVINALGLQQQTFYGAIRHLSYQSISYVVLSYLCLLWQQRRQQASRTRNNSNNDNSNIKRNVKNRNHQRQKQQQDNHEKIIMDTTSTFTSTTTDSTTNKMSNVVKVPLPLLRPR